jgi:hypothetical protein
LPLNILYFRKIKERGPFLLNPKSALAEKARHGQAIQNPKSGGPPVNI